jgi:hypothetical protein
MSKEVKKEDLKEGFRVGEYFVSFPPGEFVHEDKEGNMFVDVDIYKIENEKAYKVNDQISNEVEQLISDELNKVLSAAINEFEKERDNVQD